MVVSSENWLRLISTGSRAQWALTARVQSTLLPDFFEYGRATGNPEITT
jgi:hypothetical protein